MSDDPNKNNPPQGDGTGSDPAGATSGSTSIPFGELLGHIDSRIESILSKRPGKSGDAGKAATGEPDPQSVRDQLRAELAKLQGEEAAAKKDADRDVTIEELKNTVARLTEAAPVEEVNALTRFMWGKKKSA